MASKNLIASLTVLSALAAVGSADAAITGTLGQASWLLTPPASALPGALPGTPAYCWDEQTNVNYSALAVNMNTNGFFTGNTPYFGLVSGSFDSHFIHFDASAGVANAQGTVFFSSNIIAVIYDNVLLDNTDGSLGAFATTYPTFNPGRSESLILGQSSVLVSGNMLRFDSWISPANYMCELRVLTHAVPTPGAFALMGIGGLACVRRRAR